MIPLPHTAMVLAAGLGTRMRPLTDDRPKPLIEVSGRTLLDRALDPLVAAGVKRAVVNVHYRADQVEAHLKSRTDLEIILSDERAEVLETGGALAKARHALGEEPVFVVNTDAFWAPMDPAPVTAMAEAFDPERMDGLLLLADRERCLGFGGSGDFHLAPSGALSWRGDAPHAPWAFAGVRIIKPQLYDGQEPKPFSAKRIWEPLVDQGRLHGVPLNSFWLHVGDPIALKDAEAWMMCHGA